MPVDCTTFDARSLSTKGLTLTIGGDSLGVLNDVKETEGDSEAVDVTGFGDDETVELPTGFYAVGTITVQGFVGQDEANYHNLRAKRGVVSQYALVTATGKVAEEGCCFVRSCERSAAVKGKWTFTATITRIHREPPAE